MKMMLGTIIFDEKRIVGGMSGNRKYRFAHHETVGDKPKTQFLGGGLDQYTLKAHFHADFCNPKEMLDRLNEVAETGQPQPFSMYNGIYYGDFTIESITLVYETSLDDGSILSAEVDIVINEYVPNDIIEVETKTPEKGTKKKRDADSMGSGAKSDSDTKSVVRQ
ncbi:MAG: phage tail protein [bacterium]